jgi:hypothetical protein
MAKLKAKGRTELARMERENTTDPSNNLISWERKQYVFLSDGSILSRRTVRFRSDDRLHDYGWKSFAFFELDSMDDRIRVLLSRGFRRVN